jgi:hypothetical protein
MPALPSVPFVLLALAARPCAQEEVRAAWRCEPGTVELGEPFALVLELTHPPGVPGHELSVGRLELGDSWVVLGEEPASSASAEGGSVRTRRAWRVASLEAGERLLGEELARVALAERVTHILVGEARVVVGGLLGDGEDAPRPLRQFPEDFGGEDAVSSGPHWVSWVALAAALLAGTGAVVWRRRRARRVAQRPATPLERLAEIARSLEGGRGREGCYELTWLLRSAGDELRKAPRSGLTDEEWLAEVSGCLDVPRNAVSDLTAVFERAARVKYAGEAPTPWAMQETLARARAALEVLGAGGAAAPAGGTRA